MPQAVPGLLKLIDVKGGIVTADAVGCQRETVGGIVQKGAGYTTALKGNQPQLESGTGEWYGAFGGTLEALETDGVGHGRIGHRECRLLTDPSWL